VDEIRRNRRARFDNPWPSFGVEEGTLGSWCYKSGVVNVVFPPLCCSIFSMSLSACWSVPYWLRLAANRSIVGLVYRCTLNGLACYLGIGIVGHSYTQQDTMRANHCWYRLDSAEFPRSSTLALRRHRLGILDIICVHEQPEFPTSKVTLCITKRSQMRLSRHTKPGAAHVLFFFSSRAWFIASKPTGCSTPSTVHGCLSLAHNPTWSDKVGGLDSESEEDLMFSFHDIMA